MKERATLIRHLKDDARGIERAAFYKDDFHGRAERSRRAARAVRMLRELDVTVTRDPDTGKVTFSDEWKPVAQQSSAQRLAREK